MRRALICVCSIAVDNKNEKHVKFENVFFESIGKCIRERWEVYYYQKVWDDISLYDYQLG